MSKVTYLNINPANVKDLLDEDKDRLSNLARVFEHHQIKNHEKLRYYEGHISVGDVNLGIALPEGIKKLEIGCEWGAKAVDVLASRSMFDGFVGIDGNENESLQLISERNRLISEYMKACRDELKYGCTFATLSADENGKCRIRFHSPCTASALWSGELGRIDCALAIIDSVKDESDSTWLPSLLNMYTDKYIIVLERNNSYWQAHYYPHRMNRPLVVPFIWNATSDKPFGRSRIKEPIRRLIQGYVRTIANATIGLEFATSPQKYLLGVSDEQFDAVVNQKFKQYVGSILASTVNPETGDNPVFGQLQQGSIEPHVQMLRILATQFSAATGLTVTDTGVINDANPTSSDAILAQSQTLVLLAEQLNTGNGEALKELALMATAIEHNKNLDELNEEERNVIAHFKNPAMPSVALTADAAIKISSARNAFSDTDTFLEMIGFSQADIRRIKSQETRIRGEAILKEEFSDDDKREGLA